MSKTFLVISLDSSLLNEIDFNDLTTTYELTANESLEQTLDDLTEDAETSYDATDFSHAAVLARATAMITDTLELNTFIIIGDALYHRIK